MGNGDSKFLTEAGCVCYKYVKHEDIVLRAKIIIMFCINLFKLTGLILTQACQGFPQSLHANAGTEPHLGHCNLFTPYLSMVQLLFSATYSEIPTMSRNYV
jgi:hypothetical protein